MKRKPIVIFILLFTVLVVVSGVRHLNYGNNRERVSSAIKRGCLYLRDVRYFYVNTPKVDEKSKKLKEGMSLETVKAIMGTPYETAMIDGELWLHYRGWRDKNCGVATTNGFVKWVFILQQ